MMLPCTSVAAATIQNFGSWCYIRGENEAGARKVKMVVSVEGKGKTSSSLARTFGKLVEDANRRGYAEIALGILMAEDAPAGMHQRMGLTVTDTLDRSWACDAAVEVTDTDPTTGNLVVGAWRLFLYREQTSWQG